MYSMSAFQAGNEAQAPCSAAFLDSARMAMIGLTGGIGSGKSTVAALLAERGAVVIDADVISRQVVEPGSPLLAQLVERFSPQTTSSEGLPDRPPPPQRKSG